MFRDLCHSHIIQPRSTWAGQLTMLASVALAAALLATLAGGRSDLQDPMTAQAPAGSPIALWGGDGFPVHHPGTQGPRRTVDNEKEAGHDGSLRNPLQNLRSLWTAAVPRRGTGHASPTL